MAVPNRKEQGGMKCWPWVCHLLSAFSHLSGMSPKGRCLSFPVSFPPGSKSLSAPSCHSPHDSCMWWAYTGLFYSGLHAPSPLGSLCDR